MLNLKDINKTSHNFPYIYKQNILIVFILFIKMYQKYHIIIGAIASILIYFIFQVTITQAAIIFLASFLIDIDHLFSYYKKTEILLIY